MMEISLDSSSSQFIIHAYQRGEIVVNAQKINHHLVITPDKLIYPWQRDDFQEIIQLAPEIVLLGTGEKWQIVSPEILMLFYQQNIGVEIMDTLAACRTFNLLAAENRNVAAGLII